MRIRFLLAVVLLAMSLGAQTEFQFSDGGRRTAMVLAADEVFSSKVAVRSARAAREWGGGKLFQMDAAGMKKLRSSPTGRNAIVPVFYDTANLPAAEKLAAMDPEERAARMKSARRLMTAKLLVHMDASRVTELAATQPVGTETSYLAGWTVVAYADAFAALDAAEWMAKKGGFEFTPVFARETFVRQTLQRVPNDPLYPKQWHLDDTQKLNI